MGHMNVRFYGARVLEGLVGLAAAMGLEDAFKSHALATLIISDQHIRFMREALAGAPLHIVGGVLEMGECDARLMLLMLHSDSGEIAAGFQTVVVHTTPREVRPFPWSARTRALGARLRMEVPPQAAPRSIGLDSPIGRPSFEAAEALGLMQLGSGAFGSQDCDIFGRMRTDQFIARVSDNIPRLAASFRTIIAEAAVDRPGRVGGAVLEYRLLHHAWPCAGDRFVIRSGLAGVDERTQRLVHWLLDPATGEAWGSAEAVAVSLDLDARKIIEISPPARAELLKRVTPGLRL